MKNARRFQALERVGLRDRDTGAYNLAYFVDYAGKEFYKARRYGRVVLARGPLDRQHRAAAQGGAGASPTGARCATSSPR